MGEDCTGVCRKMLGEFMIRGERLIKHGNSWFFAKSIEVERFLIYVVLEFTLKDMVIMLIYLKKLRTAIKFFIKKNFRLEGSQTECAKVFCQKRNSSEFKLRPIIIINC